MNVICRISSFLFFTSMFFVVHLVLANYVAPIARPSKGAREDTKIRGEERREGQRQTQTQTQRRTREKERERVQAKWRALTTRSREELRRRDTNQPTN